MTVGRHVARVVWWAASLWLWLAPASAQTPVGLHRPALSPDGRQIAFSFRGDIWRCPASGGTATRLTAHNAHDDYPVWSPDATRIAFSSNRHGDFDIYVVRAEGGEPERLTFHPADDIACDWSPDGKTVLFSSDRLAEVPDLYVADVARRRIRRLTHDASGARDGRFSADGRTVYYTSGSQRWWQSGYAGPACSRVARIQAESGKPELLTDGNGYDGQPVTAAASVYVVSVRNGRYGVRRLDKGGNTPPSDVLWTDSPIAALAGARLADILVMERDGELWHMNTKAGGSPVRIPILVATDVRSMPRQTVRQTSGFSDLAVSPDGKRVAFVAGGDIWTSGLDGGDAVRLTSSPGPEGQPSWSPDGKTLIYVGTRDDSANVYSMDADTRSETRLTDDGSDKVSPRYAPDGTRFAFLRTAHSGDELVVQVLGPAAKDPLGALIAVASANDIGGFDWSPDGRWLVYDAVGPEGARDIYVAPSAGGISVNVTRASGELRNPRWSRDGRFIACAGSLFSRIGMAQSGVVVIPVTPDRPGASPGAVPPGSDASGQPDSADGPSAQRRRPAQPATSPTGSTSGPPSPGAPWPFGPPAIAASRVAIAFDGIAERVRLAVPTSGSVRTVTIAPDARTLIFCDSSDSGSSLVVADSQSRAALRLADAAGGSGPVTLLMDGSGLVWLAGDGSLRHLRRGTTSAAVPSVVCEYLSDQREASVEVFREAWRALRSSAQGHGWEDETMRQVRTRIEPLAAGAESGEEFLEAVRVLLASARVQNADVAIGRPTRNVGHLGLDYDMDYDGPGVRIRTVVPDGPWKHVAHAPVSGEYIHFLEGAPCDSPERIWERLRGLAARDVTMVVGVDPPGEKDLPGTRTLRVRALTGEDEMALRYRAEIHSASATVAELTSGTIAYTRLRGFDDDAVRQMMRDLTRSDGRARGWIVDLRDLKAIGDPAGALRVLADPAQRVGGDRPLWRMPLVVMVNAGTTGAAEALAHALRSADRAEIVGTPTAGIAAETKETRLSNGLSVLLPSRVYSDAEGKPLLGRPVTPDRSAEDDDQMAAAVERALAALERLR